MPMNIFSEKEDVTATKLVWKGRYPNMRKYIALLLTLMFFLAAIPMASAQEAVTIKVNTCIVFSDLRDRTMVEEELNSLLAEKGYNFKVEIVPFEYGNYGQLVTLALSDGSIDLFNMFGAIPLSIAADSEAIANLDELLETYGKETLELISPYISTVSVNGSVYGTPAIKSIGKRNNFLYNTEMAKEAGFVAENVHDYESLTAELLKVKEKYPDMAMISSGFGGMWFWPNMDTLGNDNYYASLILDDNAEAKVVNYYETDLYKQDIEMAKVWSENGFFIKDAINGQNAPMALLGQHQSFGCFTDNVSPEYVLESSVGNYDFEIGCVTAESEPWATTTTAAGFTWCIAELSQHKVETMQFLNLLYTDSDIANVMINGIEGVHYTLLPEGNIDYPTDVNANTVGWASPPGFMPNNWIAYPHQPITPDAYERYKADNEVSLKSPGFGFSFDSTNVMDQISACNNVCSKYLAPLMLGMGDDAMLQNFLNDLKNAGVDDIIAEKQAQLDAWLAAQ
jgi:putative aldouronate transport system substrate-binding protein